MKTIVVLRDLWRAGCAERRTSGSGSGPEKLTGGNTGRALRPDFHHNVLNLAGSVADILAEARGYRLSLTLAHQDLGQLPREMLGGISANARNKIYFSCSPEDAKILARHTLPELDEHDLAHLDAHTAAARLMVASTTTPAFTLTTRPPTPSPGRLAQVRAAVADRARTPHA